MARTPLLALAMALCLALANAQRMPEKPLVLPSSPKVAPMRTSPMAPANFTKVDLPYAKDALEPHIDTLTMNLHYDRHYNTFITNINNVLATNPNLRRLGITGMVQAVPSNTLPAANATTIRNNAGGAWNHALYFKTMAKTGSPATMETAISPALNAAITSSFPSLAELKKEMTQAATKVFGSGWAWLCYTGATTPGKALVVTTSPNQDNPLMGDLNGLIKNGGCTPILGVDVWEHAYYKKYGPARADYLKAWWNVVNWDQVSKNLEAAKAKNFAAIGQ